MIKWDDLQKKAFEKILVLGSAISKNLSSRVGHLQKVKNRCTK